jgi:hypothetical protein
VRIAVQEPGLAGLFQPGQGTRDLADRHMALAGHGGKAAHLDDAAEQVDVFGLQVHGRSMAVLLQILQ